MQAVRLAYWQQMGLFWQQKNASHPRYAVLVCTIGWPHSQPPHTTSQLLDTHAVGVRREKMYKIDNHIAAAVAGITADANILVNFSRLAAQRYQLTYQEPVPVEQLVRTVCDRKQGYTQFGGLRPFGVSMLYAGWYVFVMVGEDIEWDCRRLLYVIREVYVLY